MCCELPIQLQGPSGATTHLNCLLIIRLEVDNGVHGYNAVNEGPLPRVIINNIAAVHSNGHRKVRVRAFRGRFLAQQFPGNSIGELTILCSCSARCLSC
ncbi:hypothetical protein Nepgr_000467 [Nepenthes gracilis]|uniref:Uncharacterized protein n=1 Tax=Nepenthes gracilis TaxID=150966 RepID=A0AAD3P5C4_NEPGR|nr:hypothetical protein Nepgr_000467 [Nepenthes gracilis]